MSCWQSRKNQEHVLWDPSFWLIYSSWIRKATRHTGECQTRSAFSSTYLCFMIQCLMPSIRPFSNLQHWPVLQPRCRLQEPFAWSQCFFFKALLRQRFWPNLLQSSILSPMVSTAVMRMALGPTWGLPLRRRLTSRRPLTTRGLTIATSSTSTWGTRTTAAAATVQPRLQQKFQVPFLN